MQGVVMLDIFGTVTLPVGTLLFYVFLFIQLPTAQLKTSADYVPLIVVLLLLFLPAVLVLVNTRKPIYVGWMMFYLLALPVWNIVMPLYAYWNFDDFKWGETRKTEGADGDHSASEGTFDPSQIKLMRWVEYEAAFYKSIRKRRAQQARDGQESKSNVDDISVQKHREQPRDNRQESVTNGNAGRPSSGYSRPTSPTKRSISAKNSSSAQDYDLPTLPPRKAKLKPSNNNHEPSQNSSSKME
jgi:hypothetical protein